MTDVLGVMESWADGRTTVRRDDGEVVSIETRLIVAGKPVPPRPSRFSRHSDDEVERIAAGIFVPAQVQRCGEWLLRYSGGANARPNTILPVGDPGMPLDDALARAATFYAEHGRTPCAQVVAGSPVAGALEDRGWVRLRPHEADTEVLLAGVAALSRQLRDHGAGPGSGSDVRSVEHEDRLHRAWLVGNDNALANYAAVEQTLRLPDAVFASIHEDGRQVARGRVNLVDDWALFADLTVQPDRRRAGLARRLTADLVEWAAEHGATVMLLQVLADNQPAQRLYASLGFERHHAYRYLVPPAAS